MAGRRLCFRPVTWATKKHALHSLGPNAFITTFASCRPLSRSQQAQQLLGQPAFQTAVHTLDRPRHTSFSGLSSVAVSSLAKQRTRPLLPATRLACVVRIYPADLGQSPIVQESSLHTANDRAHKQSEQSYPFRRPVQSSTVPVTQHGRLAVPRHTTNYCSVMDEWRSRNGGLPKYYKVSGSSPYFPDSKNFSTLSIGVGSSQHQNEAKILHYYKNKRDLYQTSSTTTTVKSSLYSPLTMPAASVNKTSLHPSGIV
jgi:hypothetical protein